jgi:hypothetical protein
VSSALRRDLLPYGVPVLAVETVYHVRMKTLLLALALLFVAACVAVTTSAPGEPKLIRTVRGRGTP